MTRPTAIGLCVLGLLGAVTPACRVDAAPLRGWYGLPARRITPRDLGLKPREVLSFVWHGEPQFAPGAAARLLPLFDEKWTRYAIQGMVNRSGPLVWLDHTTYGYKTEYVWRAWYRDKHGFRFVSKGPSFDAFVRALVPHFNGLILYDAANSDNHFVAGNIASANFCVPVSTDLYRRHRGAFGAARVVATVGRNQFPSRRAAYGWLLANCLPRLDPGCSYCPDARFPDNLMGPNEWPDYLIGADVGFHQKAFLYNISSLQASSTLVAGGPNPQGAGLAGSPDDAATFAAIMRKLRAPAVCYGWGTAEADQSRWGHSMVHTPGAGNLSFHAAVKPLVKLPFRQDDRPRVDTPKKKVYIAFTSNEGDTLGLKANLQWWGWTGSQVYDALARFDGDEAPRLDWSDHRPRCDVPRTWYLNPLLVARFPALFDYYFLTKTPADHFACAPSGAGYVHMDFMPPGLADKHLRNTARIIRETLNVREVSLWGSSQQAAFDALARELPGIRGILPKPSGAHRYGWLSFAGPSRTPVLSAGDAYYCMMTWGKVEGNHWTIDWDKLLGYLNKVYAERGRPAFLEFYGLQNDLPEALGELRKRLDPERFEIVDLGTLMHLAAQAPASRRGVAERPAEVQTTAPLPWSNALWRRAENWQGVNGATVTATARGIRVKLAPEAKWGLARLPGILLPACCGQMNMTVRSLTGGSWVIKLQGRFDAPDSPLADYIPFGEFPHLGRYATTLDPAVQEMARAGEPLEGLYIGCSGIPGAEVVFEDLAFVAGKGIRSDPPG
ncbi:MAG: GxGYxYP family putative glycoside hydrolase [Armatimonadetes bacterium]|nr:GxGYxYP family putative glycoside hydrolase [Armatimonadota bacterium]